ncbi:MAG TPA: hypothetical protein VLM18_03630 [Croceibacterium sp.]|nr:hypothetical protein [Croceibacterium sp.]
MAGRNDAAKSASGAADARATADSIQDRDKLTDKQLAKAVLAGTVRARVSDVRRLAEAVLRKDLPKPSKKKRKKAKSGKLAKIPQKRN